MTRAPSRCPARRCCSSPSRRPSPATRWTRRWLLGPDIAELTPDDREERLHLQDPDGRPLGPDLPLLRALRGERVRDAEVVQVVPGRPRRFFRVHSRPVLGHPGVAAVEAIHDTTIARRTAQFQQCELAIARVVAEPRTDEQVLTDALATAGSMIGWDEAELWMCDDSTRRTHRAYRWAGVHDLPPRGPGILASGAGLPGRAWQIGEPVWLVDPPAGPETPADGIPLRTAMAVPLPQGAPAIGVLACYSATMAMPGRRHPLPPLFLKLV